MQLVRGDELVLQALDFIEYGGFTGRRVVALGGDGVEDREIRIFLAGITVEIVDSSAIDPDPSSLWRVARCPTTFYIDPDGTVAAALDVYTSVGELLAQLSPRL